MKVGSISEFKKTGQVIHITKDSDIIDFHKNNTFNNFTQTLEAVAWNNSRSIGKITSNILGVYDTDDKLTSICVYNIIKARRGTALEIVHGPLMVDFSVGLLEQYLVSIKQIALKEGCDYIRINLFYPETPVSHNLFKKLKYINTPFENMLNLTSVVDLKGKNPDSLLLSFSKTLRQDIRKFDKQLAHSTINTLEVVYDEVLDDECRAIYDSVMTRNEYSGTTYNSIVKESEFYSSRSNGFVAKLKVDGKVVAYETYIINNEYAVNHYGASLIDPNCKSNYAAYLDYHAMLKLINMGVTRYDFWGVSSESAINHPWNKLSFFKRRFKGQDYSFGKGKDLPLTNKYWILYLYEKMLKKKRGY